MSTFGKYASPDHVAAARMLGYTLTLGDEANWLEFAAVCCARLTEKERTALAYAALKSLDQDQAEVTADAALVDSTVPTHPGTSLVPDVGQAAIWAESAHSEDLKLYALAAFNAMPKSDQIAFLAHTRGAA